MDTETFLFGIIGVVAVAVVLTIVVILGRKRTQAVTLVARELGFSFQGRKWTDPAQSVDFKTALFRRGNARAFQNIMTGSSSGLQTSLFDYSFNEGTAGSSASYQQSIGAFSNDGLTLPEFALAPMEIAQKLDGALGNKGIRFDTNPEFSKRYRLESPDEAAARELFTPALISYLESLDPKKKWRLEGTGQTVTVYHFRKRVKPAELKSFLDETSAIAVSFFTLAGTGTPAAQS